MEAEKNCKSFHFWSEFGPDGWVRTGIFSLREYGGKDEAWIRCFGLFDSSWKSKVIPGLYDRKTDENGDTYFERVHIASSMPIVGLPVLPEKKKEVESEQEQKAEPEALRVTEPKQDQEQKAESEVTLKLETETDIFKKVEQEPVRETELVPVKEDKKIDNEPEATIITEPEPKSAQDIDREYESDPAQKIEPEATTENSKSTLVVLVNPSTLKEKIQEKNIQKK